MTTKWLAHFRQLLSTIVGNVSDNDGYPLASVETAETRLGLTLPRPLRDYYLSIGRHQINQVHNRLLPPEKLRKARERLVFMEENQWVVYWGIDSKTDTTDPVVFQSVDPDEGNWAVEGPCSQFLPAMLCWQAVNGGMPHLAYAFRDRNEVADGIAKDWPVVGSFGELSAHARDGQVICVFKEGKHCALNLGIRKKKDLKTLEAELGIKLFG